MGNSSKSMSITPNYSTKNSECDFYYISKDTGLSLNEVKQWHDSFMSDCPSGKLSR